MYLLYDDFMSYKEIMNYYDLKYFSKEEIKERLFENLNERDVVKECFEELERLATGEWVDVETLLDILKGYGWNIICIDKLRNELSNLEEFYARNHKKTDVFSDVIDLLRDKRNFERSDLSD